jgi:hypothetical protein
MDPRHTYHDNAWERFALVEFHPQAVRPLAPLPQTNTLYAAYQAVLEAYQWGKTGVTPADVGQARIRWCMAESLAVSRRAHERKPMEGMSGYLHLRKGEGNAQYPEVTRLEKSQRSVPAVQHPQNAGRPALPKMRGRTKRQPPQAPQRHPQASAPLPAL